MGNYTIFWKFENPRRGRQARNFSENDPKILDLKQIIFRKLSLGALVSRPAPFKTSLNISLVPFPLHLHCFQGQRHCYVTIPIVFPANHQKQSFKEVRDRPPSRYKSYVWPYVSQTLQHVTMVTLSFAKNVNECFNCTAAIQFRSFHQVRQRKRRKMWKICNKI